MVMRLIYFESADDIDNDATSFLHDADEKSDSNNEKVQ